MKFGFRISGTIKFWDTVEDSDTSGPSSSNISTEYLFAFQYWYCEPCVENRWGGGRKHCFVKLYSLLVVDSVRMNYLFRASWNRITFFSQSNKHNTLWHVLSTGYFYVSFLWTIAASDFRSLEIYENLGLPWSSITFTASSHTDNHFYKYIPLHEKCP